MANGSFLGIDVGARRLHAAAVDADGALQDVAVFGATDLADVTSWAGEAAGVAVDSPDQWSTAPHLDDLSLPPKFRTARCGEIALGRSFGLWVPWTTPPEPAPGTWIDAGIGLFCALRAGGLDPVEVYPHGAFRVLGGRRPLPRKRTAGGREARAALLGDAGIRGLPADAPHDVLDAAVAALVALHRHQGRARPATCGHDGSAIWLPDPGVQANAHRHGVQPRGAARSPTAVAEPSAAPL